MLQCVGWVVVEMDHVHGSVFCPKLHFLNIMNYSKEEKKKIVKDSID